MAYIGNVVTVLETCTTTKQKYGLYNYTDTPDITKNELASQVKAKLKGKEGVGPTVHYWLGIILDCTADLVTKITGKNLPVSPIRVKKFTLSPTFKSTKASLENFQAPFLLKWGVERTLQSRFIRSGPKKEVF